MGKRDCMIFFTHILREKEMVLNISSLFRRIFIKIIVVIKIIMVFKDIFFILNNMKLYLFYNRGGIKC